MFNRAKLRRHVLALVIGGFISSLTILAGCDQGAGKAINDLQELEGEVEKRNQKLEKLSNPD